MDPEFKKVVDHVHEIDVELKELCHKIALARRKYFQSQKDMDAQKHLQSLEEKAGELSKKHASLIAEAQRIAGIPDELLEALEDERYSANGDDEDRLDRQTLTENNVPSTELIDHELPQALECINRLVSQNWLKAQREQYQVDKDSFLKSPLSLIRGVRIESEFPSIHRFAQAIFVSEDYLNNERNTDFFAAALLVPQTASLGAHFAFFNNVGGETDERIKNLWRGESKNVDSTVFELLVASSCAAWGRTVEFLTATQEKSPDLRIHNYHFPLVVECKRKRVLLHYEIEEEHKMRELFFALHKAASMKGMWGIFDLELKVEVETAPLNDIVDCSVRQRMAAKPEKATLYEWGSIAFKELPKKLSGPTTRLYSPLFLKQVFDWDSDLPRRDGILCEIKTPKEILIDTVNEPIALIWQSNSPEAVKKKSRSPKDLFGDATNQVPTGEVGIIYVCYQEGARERLADLRTQDYINWMSKWEHERPIMLPVSFLIRIYPRTLGHGIPDLIENGVRFKSKLYGDRIYFSDFPTTVFTSLEK